MTLTWLDPIGAGIALISTYLFTKASPIAWPLSLIAILVNTALYWQKGIYGHVGLEAIYLTSTLYGWLLWTQSKSRKYVKAIARMPWQGYLILACIWPLSLVFSKALFALFESDIAYLDAITTLLALTAQFMLCQKWLECWLVWFIVDALVVGMHLYKGIPFHAASHGLYLGFAVLGYLRWSKILHQPSRMNSKVELQTT